MIEGTGTYTYNSNASLPIIAGFAAREDGRLFQIGVDLTPDPQPPANEIRGTFALLTKDLPNGTYTVWVNLQYSSPGVGQIIVSTKIATGIQHNFPLVIPAPTNTSINATWQPNPPPNNPLGVVAYSGSFTFPVERPTPIQFSFARAYIHKETGGFTLGGRDVILGGGGATEGAVNPYTGQISGIPPGTYKATAVMALQAYPGGPEPTAYFWTGFSSVTVR